MRFDVLSIFPEYLAPLELSLIGKAREDGLLSLNTMNLRDYTFDRHRTVDDTPYGGGAGMVMKPEPWGLALDAVLASSPHQSNEPAPADTAGAAAGAAADFGTAEAGFSSLAFVGSTRWIKRIMILKPIKTANTIDILISMIMSGFVVTG